MGETGPDVGEIARRQFDTACRLSGKNNSQLAKIIGAAIARPTLSRQTVVKWRHGSASIPYAAVMAVFSLLEEESLTYVFDTLRGNLARIKDGFKERA